MVLPPIEGYRLSPQQRRLWLLLPAGAPASAQCALLLAGPLAPDALRQAVDAVVARHQILRTAFCRPAGIKVPLQVPDGAAAASWHALSLLARDQSLEDLVERLLEDEARAPFDLAGGPVLRAGLAPLGPLAGRRHLLILTVSALCADHQSLLEVGRELAADYAAAAAGAPSPATEPVQYLQYSEWQNEVLAEPAAAPAREWLRALTPRHVLPPGREGLLAPTPPGSGDAADVARLPLTLPAPLAARLGAVAGELGSDLATLMLAAWQALLWRLTGEPDVAVRVPFPCRPYEELQEVVGPCEKVLPVACTFGPGTDLAGAVRQAEAARGAALAHLEHAAAEDDDAGAALAAAGFEHRRLPAPATAAGVRFTLLACRGAGEPATLRLTWHERDGDAEPAAEIAFAVNRFDRGQAAALGAKLLRLLAAVAARPEQALAAIDLLSDEERQEVLIACNQTARDLPAGGVAQLFAAQRRRTPSHVAVEFEGEELTYDQLAEHSNRLAHHLRALGVGPETVVGLCLERSPALVEAMLAVLAAGGAYLPLDPLQPPARLAHMLADAGVRLVLTEKRFLDPLPGGLSKVCLDLEAAAISRRPATDPGGESDPRALAYVLFTSGSTGRPKGVQVTQRGLVNYLTWCAEAYAIAQGGGALVHSPASFDLTVTTLVAPLLTGQRVILTSEARGIEGLAAALARPGLSLVKLTPSHLEVLHQLMPAAPAAGGGDGAASGEGSAAASVPLRVVLGGEALKGETLAPLRTRWPAARLFNEYGPTETVVGSIVHEVPAGTAAGRVPIGRPIANTRVYVLDEWRQPALPGVAGELYLGGAGVARGYAGRPAETAERFVPDPCSGESGTRLYRTGDRVRFRPDGELEFLGRLDDQVKIRGFRVEPGEVEQVLAEHPEVHEAAVVVRPDALGEPRLVAYVVSAADLAELRSHLRERLPEPLIPSALLKLPALPLTENGKVDRRALPAPDPSRVELHAPYVMPRTPVEEILAAIWPKVLGVDQVGIDDNFFTLGGDSIRSVRAVALAKERGLHSTVELLFEHQTIRELAQEIRSRDADTSAVVSSRPFVLIADADRPLLPDGLDDAYPLSVVQLGMLYHLELDHENPAYHNVNTWHLRALFDREALLAAVDRVVARHPVLRTSFDLTTYREPLQLVHRDARLQVGFDDLRGMPVSAQEELLRAFWSREARSPFQLTEYPYLRFHVHRRSEETFQFTLVELHAILDGWSTSSTLAEIFETYLQLSKHRVPRLIPPLATAFRDFVLLERRTLESAAAERFWAEQLAGAATTRLPRWPGRPCGEGATRVERIHYDVPAGVAAGVRTVANTVAVPFKTALLAAHLKVVSLAVGETDLLTGLVTNGRLEQLDGERVRGMFLNSVPLRFTVGPGSWSDLVRDAFNVERDLLPHRRYPLGALQGRWGRQPIFEISFAFLNFHSVQGLLSAGEIEVLQDNERDFSFTNFTLNLTFFLSPVSANLRILMEYDANQIDPAQMLRLRDCYARVLAALAADPLARHDGPPPLAPEERRELLAAWNATRAGDALVPFHQGFAAQAERTPEAPAVECEGERLTYRDLDRRANRLAHRLRQLGVGPEAVVGLLLERRPEALVAILGVLKAGAAYLPLDPAWPRERLAFVLTDAGASLALSVGRLAPTIEPTVHVLRLDDEEPALAAGPESAAAGPPPGCVDLDQLAYVLFTSGSTGRPKGALLTHRGLANYLAWASRAFGLAAGEGAIVHSPLTFDLTITCLLGPLLAGNRVRLIPGEHGVAALGDALAAGRDVSLVKLTPSHLDLLAQQLGPAGAAGRVRCLVVGGESLTAESVRFWQEHAPETVLINEYGPTETVVATVAWRVPAEAPQVAGAVPIGRPIAGSRACVLDPGLEPVPVGMIGELWLGGPGLARGYLGRPAATAAAFRPDPWSGEPGARLYRTGDRALVLPGGDLVFQGRRDDQVKVRGYRIELDEVAAIAAEHPAVQRAVAVVREDEPGARRLVLYVVPQPAAQPPREAAAGEAPHAAAGPAETGASAPARLDAGELRAFLRQRLPEYMLPAAILALAELPLTAHGKVDRRALPSPPPERPDLGETYRAPQGGLEETITRIWQEVLKLDQVGRNDNFFELGGNSLALLLVSSRLRRLLDRDFKAMQLLRYPTIRSLAAYLDGAPEVAGAVEADARLEVLRSGSDLAAQQREKLRGLRG